jgi:hypothetical protein
MATAAKTDPGTREHAASGILDLISLCTVAFPSWAGLLFTLYVLRLPGFSPVNLFWRNPR